MMQVTVKISYESHISFMAQSINPPARYLNTLRPRQNDCLFTDDTFKRIFLNENIRISNKISLKFVPNGLINNIPALVLIMAWHLPGDKPLSEQWWLDNWRIFASLGLNELNPGPPHSWPKRIPCSYPFSQKRGIFSMGDVKFAKSVKKGSFFRHESAKFKKVFACYYFHLFVPRVSIVMHKYIWGLTIH